jgi:hypothetical protein
MALPIIGNKNWQEVTNTNPTIGNYGFPTNGNSEQFGGGSMYDDWMKQDYTQPPAFSNFKELNYGNTFNGGNGSYTSNNSGYNLKQGQDQFMANYQGDLENTAYNPNSSGSNSFQDQYFDLMNNTAQQKLDDRNYAIDSYSNDDRGWWQKDYQTGTDGKVLLDANNNPIMEDGLGIREMFGSAMALGTGFMGWQANKDNMKIAKGNLNVKRGILANAERDRKSLDTASSNFGINPSTHGNQVGSTS